MNRKSQEQESIIQYLSDKQEAILKEWEDRASNTEGKSTALAAMSRDKFRDHIPAFLEGYYESLKDDEVSLEDIGRKHGSERWEYGLNLQQTMKEWNLLHQVVMEQIDQAHEEKDVDFDIIQKVQKTLLTRIHEGILYSVKEFDRLKNSETEAQLLDLQQALEEPVENPRDHNLRSTSHDLKGIMKNLQMGFFLLEDEELDGRAAELIGQMEAAADSLEKLLSDLLDLFRLETQQEEIHLSSFDAAEVLYTLGESMQPMAQTEKLDLIYEGEEPLKVKTDEKKLERITRNLVLNALKYTKEGRVEIKWGTESDDQWVLEVNDTGPGLNVTHAKSLTTEADASSTIEEAPEPGEVDVPSEVERHGEGIGLLIVRHLCQLLDAILKVDTKPGEGTSFKITFPRELSAG